MILLDTNVVSEPLRPHPEARVIAWIDAQAMETLYLSAISVAELRSGVALLPAGRRRTRLHNNLEERILPLFTARVLSFDTNCTNAYAGLLAKTRRAGCAIGTADALIAAIALANKFSIATRDAAPFLAAGAKVINPWGE